MNKIVSYITNGLGNQLFQYAVGYALSSQHNMEFVLNTEWFQRDNSRSFELDVFNIDASIQNEFNPNINLNDSQPDRRHVFEQIHLSNQQSYGLSGYWLHSNYFIESFGAIKHQFTLRDTKKIEQRCANILKQIRTKNSIAIHVRRTDFLHQKSRQVADYKYYNCAILKMIARGNNPHLVFFSDDIDWVKNNMQFNVPTTYSEDNSTIEDFYLMSQCKHNIIPNSTFSWWAAQLNSNPDKVIIYPNKWNTTHQTNTLSDNVPEECKRHDK